LFFRYRPGGTILPIRTIIGSACAAIRSIIVMVVPAEPISGPVHHLRHQHVFPVKLPHTSATAIVPPAAVLGVANVLVAVWKGRGGDSAIDGFGGQDHAKIRSIFLIIRFIDLHEGTHTFSFSGINTVLVVVGGKEVAPFAHVIQNNGVFLLAFQFALNFLYRILCDPATLEKKSSQ